MEPTDVVQAASSSPSYDFPGTWSAAIQDTSAAASTLSEASKSYANALVQSGVGRAGRSVSSAVLNSTGKRASNFAGWVMDRAGVVPNDLPRPLREWLRRKQQREGRSNIPRRMGSQAQEPGMEASGPIFMEDENSGWMIDTIPLDGPNPPSRNRPAPIEPHLNRKERAGWQAQHMTPNSASTMTTTPSPLRLEKLCEAQRDLDEERAATDSDKFVVGDDSEIGDDEHKAKEEQSRSGSHKEERSGGFSDTEGIGDLFDLGV